MTLTKADQERLGIEVGRVFTPAAPINETALFSGRRDQVRRVIDGINQRGQHVIIFGERGVGKTSLANVLTGYLKTVTLAPRVNCDGADDYASIWRKVFSEIELTKKTKAVGFVTTEATETQVLSQTLPKKITPELVRQSLTLIGGQVQLIVVIDEFDRLPEGPVRRLFADTIKTLSDHSIPVTLVVVGVADTVDTLIAEHQSIERALVQVQMPRMSRQELEEIITKGLDRLKMAVNDDALRRIALLSQGLPHYTHLLGLHAAREAIDHGEERVSLDHVTAAIQKALTQAQQTIRGAYHKATTSPRKETLYAKVLLACALAESDELGYFAAADVRDPITHIMKKKYEIPSFARHLNHFCDEVRGRVLQKTGMKHRFRFRFVNPLLQPFVIMQGLADGLITGAALEQTASPGERKKD